MMKGLHIIAIHFAPIFFLQTRPLYAAGLKASKDESSVLTFQAQGDSRKPGGVLSSAFHNSRQRDKSLYRQFTTRDSIYEIPNAGGENSFKFVHRNFHHSFSAARPFTSYKESSESFIKALCGHAKDKHVCYRHGKSQCTCQGHIADCSGRPYYPNIHYIPKLPPNIRCLEFRYNKVQHFDDSYFANVTKFDVIDFTRNDLETVSTLTFKRFTNLKYLILNGNPLSYKHIRRVLQYPPSLRLDLVAVHLFTIPKDYFQPYSNMTTKGLYLDQNNFGHFDFNEISVLTNLQYLSLQNSEIETVQWSLQRSLISLDMSYNSIEHFPETCVAVANHKSSGSLLNLTNNNTSLFPKMGYFNIEGNRISSFPRENMCLPLLKELCVTNNTITEIPSFALASLPSLKTFYLGKMRAKITKVGKSAFAHPRLTYIYFANNNIDMSGPNISSLMFNTCKNLKVMYVNNNIFSSIENTFFVNILSGVPNLQRLYLGSSNISVFPPFESSNLSKLISLYLYDNAIEHIPKAAFDNMQSLEFIYLDRNKINSISDEVFSDAARDRLKGVDLSHNDFQCGCDLLWFRNWLVQNGSKLFSEFDDGYQCHNIPDTRVQDFRMSKQMCLFSHRTYVIFTVVVSAFLTLSLGLILFYVYRWNIRLFFYERQGVNQPVPADDNEYEYDVFIVHSNSDTEWVLDHLCPKIENEWGLKACIHERDFIAGGAILWNIDRAITSSRKIVIVTSTAFSSSNWCNCELNMCQNHIIENNRDQALIIQLEDIENMSRAMLALRKSTTFLEAPSHVENVPQFWNRLHRWLMAHRKQNQ